MASQRKKIFVDFKGLVTSPGQLARPVGSFSSLVNMTTDGAGLIRKREGFYSSAVNGASGTNYPTAQYIHKAMPLNGVAQQLLATGSTREYSSGFVCYFKDGDPEALGTITAYSPEPAALSVTTDNYRETEYWSFRAKAQSAQLGDSTYATSGPTRSVNGILRFDGAQAANSVRHAGSPKGLVFARQHYSGGALRNGCELTPAGVTAGTLLGDGESVAYRYVINFPTRDGIDKLGSPSGRFVITNQNGETNYNAATVKDVSLSLAIPYHVNSTNTVISDASSRVKLEVYRTTTFPSGTTPDDEMFLCYERWLTSAELSSRYFTFTDNRSDALLGAPLYTNTSSGDVDTDNVAGLLNANDPPPTAVCVEAWDGRVWYGQTALPQTIEIQIVAPLVAGDSIELNAPGGTVFTARAAGGALADGEFSVGPATFTGFQLIEYQALAFCSAVNLHGTNNQFYAYYIGTGGGVGSTAPGRILLQKRTPPTSVNATFSVTPAQPTKWSPYDSSGAALRGIPSIQYGTLWFSKVSNGDAVPPDNFLNVVSNLHTIIALKALEEGLYVFTTDGVFIIVGRNGGYAVELVDRNCIPLNREVLTVCDGSIFVWTIEGVARIRAGRIDYVSEPVKDSLRFDYLSGFGQSSGSFGLDQFKGYTFACADQTRHRVMFWLPQTFGAQFTENNYASKAYVYNTREDEWSVFTPSLVGLAYPQVSSGCYMNGSSQLLLSEWGTSTALLSTRHGITSAQYADAYGTSSTARAIVSGIVTNFESPEFESKVFWEELHILWENNLINTAIVPPTSVTVTFTGDFGAASAGTITISPTNTRMMRVLVPTSVRHSAQMAVTITHQVASEPFGIVGMTLWYSGGSKETVR